jgi:o-succinylbenzoate synthase
MPFWRSASPISPGSRVCLSFLSILMWHTYRAGHPQGMPHMSKLICHTKKHTTLMKIIDIQWHTYRLPFLHKFHTAHGFMDTREGVIVQVTTNEGVTGIGEIAPLPTFNGGSLADACSLLPELNGHLYYSKLYEALELLAGEKVSTKSASTLCGLEIALLDALGKTTDCSVSTLLSPAHFTPREAVPVNAVISAKATKAAAEIALNAKKNGFPCVKLKVGLGLSISEEVERIATVRDTIGPTIHLRLDANEAWQLEEAIAILSQCVPYNIQYIEQPLKAQNLVGMRTLRQEIPIPIAVDEAVHDLESVYLVLDNEVADILVIKPQLAGGLRIAQQMIRAASESGVYCVITSTIEAGIGLAAELHLVAASPQVTLECGLATLPLLADDLLAEELLVRDGFLAVPTGPGLGVGLDQQALDRYSSGLQ